MGRFGLLVIVLTLSLASSMLAAQPASLTAQDSAWLNIFLRDYVRDSYPTGGRTVRYFARSVDLADDGKRQVIVYFTDQHSCASGGCTTLVLAHEGSSFRIVTSITIGWPPIRVLSIKTKGWHDLAIWVQGGGIQPGYEADLPFDGKTYPINPSMPPARRLLTKVPGEVVVPKGAEGVLLYQK
jgi:hypothetical protein